MRKTALALPKGYCRRACLPEIGGNKGNSGNFLEWIVYLGNASWYGSGRDQAHENQCERLAVVLNGNFPVHARLPAC